MIKANMNRETNMTLTNFFSQVPIIGNLIANFTNQGVATIVTCLIDFAKDKLGNHII